MIVGFCGYAGSGKSEAAKYLIKNHGFVRGKFAGALKEMTRAFLRYRGADDVLIERMIEGDLKETENPFLNGCTPRYWMTRLGTEFGRNKIHPDLWVDTEINAVRHIPFVVFDDVRFMNEANAIRREGGVVIRIQRDGVCQVIDHVSEVRLDNYDHVICNNGTIKQLHSKIEALLQYVRVAQAA